MYSISDVGNICFICLVIFAVLGLIGLEGAGAMVGALAVVVFVAAMLQK